MILTWVGLLHFHRKPSQGEVPPQSSWLLVSLLMDTGYRLGVTNSLSASRFSQLSPGFRSQILSHSHSSSPPPDFHIYFLVCMDSKSEHYEGLPSPDVIQSKKSRNWFLIFLRCCISSHLWEHTASIISHLITLSRNGYRTAAVSASRGLTCTLKSNWRLYLMYLFKIWK